MTLDIACVAHGDDTFVVSASGELDASSSPALRAMIADAIDHSGAHWIAVDLLDVQFMDSSAIAVMAGARQRLGPDGTVTIVCRTFVSGTFERTGLGGVFGLHLTCDDALRYLADCRLAA